MDAVPKPAPMAYPSARYIDYSEFTYYYAYGNTPPEDLLEHVHVEDEKEPRILSLGCGDIRSCFYTLWKHFDPSVSGRPFAGVRFVLNDISAAVLARNVLFLHLALKIPPCTERETVKQWIAGVWAIWYCHELLPAHDRMLREALDTLLSFSGTMRAWEESSSNVMRFVSFTDSATLRAINRMWKLWRSRFKVKPRKSKRRVPLFEPGRAYVDGAKVWLREVGLSNYATEEACDKMFATCSRYESEGSVYAEECLDLACSNEGKVVNPTLYEREDGAYTLHYASTPFICFYNGFIFSKSELKKLGMRPDSALFVKNGSFLKQPLLSNCVQQFSMWVSSSAAILNAQISKQKHDITFSFNCSDCVVFLEELQSRKSPLFDTIFTTNLIDRIPSSILVLTARPLLKITSYVITTSLFYKKAFSSSEEYLVGIFGIDPSLLPVLFGIRCIGQDGKYADTISSFPMPVLLQDLIVPSTMISQLSNRREKVLLWQRVNSQHIIISSLEETVFSVGLSKAIVAQLLSFYQASGSSILLTAAICTETAINTILSFVSQLDADVDISCHSFWSSLCTLLRSESSLRPFLVHIQTQALLHGLHFHLTVTDISCPVCLKKPLHEFINRFSIKFNPLSMNRMTEQQGETPKFVIIIHKVPAVESRLSNLLADDHIVDSMQALKLQNGKLLMNFFLPAELVEGYFCTVIRYIIFQFKEMPVATLCMHLSQQKVSFQQNFFYFKQAGIHRTKTVRTSLAQIISHHGDSDQFKTTLILSVESLSLLSTSSDNICLKQLSHSTIQLVCGNNDLSLNYPYPINYNEIKVEVSRSKGTVKIFAPRKNSCVSDENRVFLANPNNLIMLPPMQLSTDRLQTILGMQYSENDRIVLRKLGHVSTSLPVMVRIKQIFTIIFEQLKQSTFFAFTSGGDILALIFIHRQAIEIQRCTPVLDIYYAFYDEALFSKINTNLQAFLQNIESFDVNEETWLRLKQLLIYFANRTQPSSRLVCPLLSKHDLEDDFTRAILYPLYCDQDVVHKLVEEQNLEVCLNEDLLARVYAPERSATSLPGTTTREPNYGAAKHPVDEKKNCNYCGKWSDKLKNCTRCWKTRYCSKECQTEDWKRGHKIVCKPPTADLQPAILKCSNCGKLPKEGVPLKRCTGCQLVAYCTKECQRNDWLKHKPACTAAK